jgi:hypothetical protein
MKYEGDPARRWREQALLGDETSLKAELRSNLEALLPSGMEITVTSLGELQDSEKPLVVTYTVSGSIGTSTGKRLLVPANLFEARAKPLFPSERRDVVVDMRLGSYVQDAVRYKVPTSFSIESPPAADAQILKSDASFDTSSKVAGNSITLFRDVAIARVMFSTADYPQLRDFYKKLEARDQETLVLTRNQAAATGTGAPDGAVK